MPIGNATHRDDRSSSRTNRRGPAPMPASAGKLERPGGQEAHARERSTPASPCVPRRHSRNSRISKDNNSATRATRRRTASRRRRPSARATARSTTFAGRLVHGRPPSVMPAATRRTNRSLNRLRTKVTANEQRDRRRTATRTPPPTPSPGRVPMASAAIAAGRGLARAEADRA